MHLVKKVSLITTLAIGATTVLAANAMASTLRVTVDNLAPNNGNFLTPVWVGFHDGSFDIYDRDASLNLFPGTEALVEDGNTAPISTRFTETITDGVQGTLLGPTIDPIAPGESTNFTFDVDSTSGQYFSYASMIIPSNDAFIANGNPLAHQIFDDAGNFIGADFVVLGNQVLDGGTEVNDEAEFSTAFLGQQNPNTGTDENGVVTLHPGFIPTPDGRILSTTDFNGLNFTGADFTTPGYEVARIRVEAIDDIEAVPEPGIVIGLLILGGGVLLREFRVIS